MKIDQDLGIDDEAGGEIDGAAACRAATLSARKRRTSSRKARSSGLEQEIQGNSSYAISRPGGRDLRVGDDGAVAAQMLAR